MKISEMTNDQAADVMIRLAEPIGKICDDEEAVAMVDDYKRELRKPMFYVIGRLIPRLVAYFMKSHRREVYEITSILSGKPLDGMGKLKFAETVAIIRDSYDDVLATFFPRYARATGGSAEK